jgi:hypothetical protein
MKTQQRAWSGPPVSVPTTTPHGPLWTSPSATAVVVLGQSRAPARDEFTARLLGVAGFSTLLVDLDEGAAAADVPRMAERLLGATGWLRAHELGSIGCLCSGAGAAAALLAAALRPGEVHGLVSRFGHPELAGAALLLASVPALLLVDAHAPERLAKHQALAPRLRGPTRLEVFSGVSRVSASRLEERVAAQAARWFATWLRPQWSRLRQAGPSA